MIHYIKVVVCLLACLVGVYPQSERVVIRSLVLEGNEHVSINEVLFIIRQRPPKFFIRHPKFEPRLLKLDALTLKSFYHSSTHAGTHAINEFRLYIYRGRASRVTGESYFESETPIFQRMMKSDQT